MKRRSLYLVGLPIAIMLLVSCVSTPITTVQTMKYTDNASPVSALPEPSPSILETLGPAFPADTSPTPESSEPTLLTFDEAREICGTWLDKHTDVPSDAFHEWVVDPYEIPPPTYYLFDVPYYKFFVTYSRDGTSGFSHSVLVQAETGELLSLYEVWSDEKSQTTTVELLDDWYAGELTTFAPARMTNDDAIAVYDAWLQEHSVNPYDTAELEKQSNGKYVLFGEQYYVFNAKDGWAYWYNILVHMETGELLFMLIEDGMFGGTSIMPLDDWHAGADSQFRPN